MVFHYSKKIISAKKAKKIRFGYQCFGCNKTFRSRKRMQEHQGDAWPGCPQSVDNLFDTAKQAVQ